MKRIKISLKTIAAAMFAFATITSCNDQFFETQPDDLLSIESVFQNRQQTEQWWAGMFSLIPDPWNYPYTATSYGVISDELDASNWGGFQATVNSGAINADNSGSAFDHIAHYERIRNASIFLENIDRNKEILGLNNGAELVKQYKGEAQFLRAYYYWNMMKHLGPVPIQPLTPGTAFDNYQIPRPTWDDQVAFILKEMDEAKEKLPEDYYIANTTDIDNTEVGRINKLIVEAVQSQILLFSASPLVNGNTEMSNFKNFDGTQLINQSYDANKWTKAAEAAKRAIEKAHSQGKGLYVSTEGTDTFTKAYRSVRDLYWDGWRTEGIWLRPSSNTWNWSAHAAPRSTRGIAYNGIAVIQRLVDEFQMSDGRDRTNSPSYSETTYTTSATPYYVAGTNRMYVGREPRFYAWVSFNGAVNPGASQANQDHIQFFYTGTSGASGAPRDWPKTGYTARKNIHPTFSMNPSINPGRPAMLIRLAELYLNYAEALNESQPGHTDILTYLNRVRTRAGLPGIAAGKSQAEMRDIIRHERRIELCFEGHRYFDVRRWKVAGDGNYNQGGAFYGMNMTAGTHLSDPAFHTRTVAFTRAAWSNKRYFLPFRQNEIDRNKQLVQIPGY